MELYKKWIDVCSGSKYILILGNDKRALFGLFPGYISIFYRMFPIKYELVNTERLGDVLNTCDVRTLTQAKIMSFMNEPLSFWDKIHYKYMILYRKYKGHHLIEMEHQRNLKRKDG